MVAPLNDNFADAIQVDLLTIGAEYDSGDMGSDLDATMETGEPSYDSAGIVRSIWWKYTPAHSGESTFDASLTGGTSSRRRLAIFTGSAVNALSEVISGNTMIQTLTVQAGVTYYIRTARSSSSYSGNPRLKVSGQTTVVTRAPGTPTLTLIPEGTTILVKWGAGYQTTWQTRINGGAWLDKGASGEHLYTGLTVGSTYTIEVQGTNSFGPSPIGSRTIVMPNMLVWDDFARANSTSVVGAGATGPAPVVKIGTWGINAGQLYPSAVSSSNAMLVWSCGTPNVDVRVKRTAVVDNGGIFVGAEASGNNAWLVNFLGSANGQTILYRYMAGTFVQIATGRGGPDYLSVTSVLRVVVNNNILQAWSDTTLLMELELPEPMLGTYHGIRATSTSHRFDDLTIRESTEITLAADDAAMVTQAYAARAAEPPQIDAFVYRGRDTKIYDHAGGA